MSDNSTAHPASEYETEVGRTIPFHDELLRTAVDVALAAASPGRWLDTGAGPGKLATLVRERVPAVEMWLADPSQAMLGIARARSPAIEPGRFLTCKSEDLPDGIGPFDVITAIQCHHYGDASSRERAITRCRDLLAPRGALIVFENVRAETERAHALQRDRWAAWQRKAGRDEAAVSTQLAREGMAFFPIRVSEHLALFARLGLEAEIIWRAYGQAGFLSWRRELSASGHPPR